MTTKEMENYLFSENENILRNIYYSSDSKNTIFTFIVNEPCEK